MEEDIALGVGADIVFKYVSGGDDLVSAAFRLVLGVTTVW